MVLPAECISWAVEFLPSANFSKHVFKSPKLGIALRYLRIYGVIYEDERNYHVRTNK